MSPSQRRSIPLRLSLYALMLLLSVVFLFPFLFMLASSLKTNDAIFADLESIRALLPVGHLSLANYAHAFERGQIGHYLFNSLLVTIITVVLGLLVNSLAAFALARLEWHGKQFVLTLLVILLVVPFEAISVPLMLLVAKLPGIGIGAHGITMTGSWLDTIYVQIIPFVANAFSIFLFYQFFRDIPKDFDEAAYVDGASPMQVFIHVIIPSSLPVFATVTILQALAMWNQYLWPLITVPGEAARPLMVGMEQFFGARKTAWGEVMAYAALITVPVLISFIFFQRWFVRSVVGSGVKG